MAKKKRSLEELNKLKADDEISFEEFEDLWNDLKEKEKIHKDEWGPLIAKEQQEDDEAFLKDIGMTEAEFYALSDEESDQVIREYYADK